MPANPSPLQSLRDELASSSTAPSMIAARFGPNANSNVSHNTYLGSYSTEALNRAERLSQIVPEGASRLQLYGIPISIKDCFDVAGTVTTCGSRFYEQHNPLASRNSWVAGREITRGSEREVAARVRRFSGPPLEYANTFFCSGSQVAFAEASILAGTCLCHGVPA